MRTIMVMNAKGGCGKSTLATSIAAYYASHWEGVVALADYDPQTSSLDWLAKRPAERDPIVGVNAVEEGLKHLPRNTDYLIIDPPARAHGSELTQLVRHAETIVVPVLPSPIDITAAAKFIQELLDVGKVERREVRLAVVANRIRENLLVYGELEKFLDGLKVPFIARFRDAQNYIRAYSRGLGIHELPPYLADPDWKQWNPLVEWLESRKSRPT
ncbi:MAG TPA: ParA family protein [Gammaproteobacteria bacterium]|nr:ParA family protein [Gammaproteobacteria bacterium]